MRPVCTSCGHVVFFDPKVAAIAFVSRDHELLLVQRAMDPGRGLWSLAGGFVEVGEHPKDSLKREILEETGLIIQVDQLLDVFQFPQYHYVITIAYAATVIGGTLRAGDDVAQAVWFSADSLPELAFETTQILVRRWISDDLQS
jgi:ADP-ribose pyrophosphatase YjhB (NUDIX family)